MNEFFKAKDTPGPRSFALPLRWPYDPVQWMRVAECSLCRASYPGVRALTVVAPTPEAVNHKLDWLAHTYGWTKLANGEWECSAHRMPDTSGRDFVRANAKATALESTEGKR